MSVGVSGDTAEFAVESLRKWWVRSGKMVYGSCRELLVTCDCGGSNGYRVRLWRWQLQLLANELGKNLNSRRNFNLHNENLKNTVDYPNTV